MLQFSLLVFSLIYNIEAITDVKTRIVNGSDVPDGGLPYQVSLRIEGYGHFCGGSILNSKWILTASHCIEKIPYTQYIRVVVGTNNVKSGGQEYKVLNAIKHPDYARKNFVNDICLLEISGSISFNDRVKSIALPEADTKPGANLLVSGWGLSNVDPEEFPDKLQMLNVTAISVDDCREQLGKFITIDQTKLCTTKQKGTSACSGDSGGPLVEENSIVGIASFVITPCGAFDYPDAYTRVYVYKNWIKDIIT